MDNKSLECFACEPRARGVRIDVSPQQSLVLPHEHFVYAEFSAGEQSDSLKLVFVTHEIKLTGFPERFAQQALGHNSKAAHRAYAKHVEVTVPSLADWEKDWQENPQRNAQHKLQPVDFRSSLAAIAQSN